jgi:hypoxanthine-DNA glycosylase
MQADGARRLVGLPPIVDAGVRVLILGSFPSPASLAAQRYYAHPQNQFWRLLADVLAVPLPDLDYAGKQRALLAAGIGVWDVYGLCQREGSLDSAIRAAQPNDFACVTRVATRLHRVCFNGKTAARFAPRLAAQGFDTCVLPSSSPAYTLAFAGKLALWRAALSVPNELARR